MDSLLQRYRTLLSSVDAWFSHCQRVSGNAMACRDGCAGCCRGLFDISLLDARLLRQGFDQLPPAVQAPVLTRARQRLVQLQGQWPDFAHPFILNRLPDEQWTEMPEEDSTPCPLLDDQGRCLVYAWRPMLCRTHGIPLLDLSGECFDARCCNLNFRGKDPLQLPELRHDFRGLFAAEFNLLGEFATELCGRPLLELDTFIPTALLLDCDAFDWRRWSREHCP